MECGDAGAAATPVPAVAELPLDGYLLLRDHVRSTFAFNRTSLAGHGLGALIVEIIFASVAPSGLLFGWGLLFAIVWMG